MSTLFLVFGLIFPRLTLTFASLTGNTPSNDITPAYTVIDFILSPRTLIAGYAMHNKKHIAWTIAYYITEFVVLCALVFFLLRYSIYVHIE